MISFKIYFYGEKQLLKYFVGRVANFDFYSSSTTDGSVLFVVCRSTTYVLMMQTQLLRYGAALSRCCGVPHYIHVKRFCVRFSLRRRPFRSRTRFCIWRRRLKCKCLCLSNRLSQRENRAGDQQYSSTGVPAVQHARISYTYIFIYLYTITEQVHGRRMRSVL